MPLYDYLCSRCGAEAEMLQQIGDAPPICCGEGMGKRPTYPAMTKIKGEGGFPSRRKWLSDWTPESPKFGSTGSLHGEKY